LSVAATSAAQLSQITPQGYEIFYPFFIETKPFLRIL
jgi:hypothetical protein